MALSDHRGNLAHARTGAGQLHRARRPWRGSRPSSGGAAKLFAAVSEALEPRRLLCTVTGSAFIDSDSNGMRNGDETGVAGGTVFADLNGDGQVDGGDPSTVTAADGTYTLEGVPAGTDQPVLVRMAPPPGWAVISPAFGYFSFEFADDSASAGADFAIQPTATISGAVTSTGEWSGLGGRTVFLDDNGNGTPDEGELSTVTDWSGNYSIGPVAPGSAHLVSVVPQPGWHQTDPDPAGPYGGGQGVSVPSDGTPVGGVNFVFQPDLGGSVRGNVFLDANSNGSVDADEPGLDGWMLYVDSNNNGQIDDLEQWTRTDAAGNYEIDGLPLFTSQSLRVVGRPGWTFTAPSTDGSQGIWMGPDAPVESGVNFGATSPTSISGTVRRYDPAATGGSTGAGVAGVPVFDDLNGDGVPDDGDVTAVTDTSGNYTLTGVPFSAGQSVYVLPWGAWQQSLPAGGAPLGVSVTPDAPAVTGADFGMDAAAGTVSGAVFADPRGDFALSGGDLNAGPGLGGRTVFYDENANGYFDEGEPSAVTSDDGGTYTIPGVPLYSYAAVRLLGQGGWGQTFPSPDSGTVVYLTGVDPDAYGVNLGQSDGGIARGTVFLDFNADGVRDANEPAAAGRVVYRDVNGNGALDDGEPSTTTAPDGTYVLSGLELDVCQPLRLVSESGWAQTSPAGPWNGADAQWLWLWEGNALSAGLDFGQRPLPAPTDFGARPVSTSEVGLAWANADSTAGVLVQRSDDGGATWQTLTAAPLDPGTTTYQDTGLTEGTAYSYRLLAAGPGGSTSVPGDPAPVNTLPLAPINLSATEDQTGGVALSWTDQSTHADGYEVFSSTDDINYSLLDLLPADAASYTDHGPAYGQINYYRVRATAGGSESDPSNTASLTPAAPPTAADDRYSVLHDQSLPGGGPAYNLLSNDTSPGGAPLSVAGATASAPLTTATAHGSVTLNADGTFTYTPAAGYAGPDSFTYAATDGIRTSHPATVNIDVTDQSPRAASTWALSTNTNATNADSAAAPAADYTGWDYFLYRAVTGDNNSSPVLAAAVDITDSLPQLPKPDAQMWTYQGQAQDLDLRLQYVDAQHPKPSLVAAVVPGLGPKHGTLTPNGDGTFTYVPDDGYTGPDSFTYTVSDGVISTRRALTGSADEPEPDRPACPTDSNYQTCFFDVRPLPVSLAVDDFAAGDSNAVIVVSATDSRAPNVLHLNYPAGLPAGTQVTLKLESQTPDDGTPPVSDSGLADLVRVYDAAGTGLDPDLQPPGINGKLILGTDGTQSAGRTYTWTVGDGDAPPAEVLVGGNADGRVVFDLEVTPGGDGEDAEGVYGPLCADAPADKAPPPNPATKPAEAKQDAKVTDLPVHVDFTFRATAPGERTSEENGNPVFKSTVERMKPKGDARLGKFDVGKGRDDGSPSQCICASELMAQLVPANEDVDVRSYEYRMNRTVATRVWWLMNTGSDDKPEYTVRKAVEFGIRTPRPDMPDSEINVYHTNVPNKNRFLFAEDASGVGPGSKGFGLPNTDTGLPNGWYLWADQRFVYTVEMKIGNDWKEIGRLMEYQTIVVKRVHETGDPPTDFEVIQNAFSDKDSQLTISEKRIQAATGIDAKKVALQPGINDPDPETQPSGP